MRRPEQALAIAAAQFLRVALRPPTVWFCVDHGAGRMTPAAAGLLKARGGKQGVPDLLVLHPAQAGTMSEVTRGGGIGTIVVGLELKAPTGRASPAQLGMEAAFLVAHADYKYCWGLEDVEQALRLNGIPVHATVAGNGSLWPKARAA